VVPRVLIADDDRSLRDALVRFIRSLEMEAIAFATGEELIARLDGSDLVITDLRMPGMDGMSLLGEVRRRKADLPVIVLTGHGTVALAVEAMRNGAANFLTKPFDLDDFEQAVRAGLGAPAAARARPPSKSVGAVSTRSGEVFIGESGAAQALRLLTRRVAASDATVLVTGESGAGKEVVARAVHAQSKRVRMPFVAVNCGVKLVDFGANGVFGGGDDKEHEKLFNAGTTPPVNPGAWVSLDVPLAEFTNLTTRAHLAQITLAGSSTAFIDNVYLHK
jgi:DNA-binding NtrC family response regulator